MATSVGGLLLTTNVGPGLVDGSDLKMIVSQTRSGQGGLVAKAGGGAVSAPLLGAAMNTLATVATSGDSALLPMAISGALVRVVNAGAASATIYAQTSNPNNGGQADSIIPLAGGSSTSTALAVNACAEFWCSSIGVWKSTKQ